MGYRSDVAIAVYGKEAISVQAHVAAWKGELAEETRIWVEQNESIGSDPCLYRLEFESVKWYETYQDVIQVMDLLNKLEDREYASELVGEFVRVGEEAGDSEHETFGRVDNCEYRYSVVSTIEFN